MKWQVNKKNLVNLIWNQRKRWRMRWKTKCSCLRPQPRRPQCRNLKWWPLQVQVSWENPSAIQGVHIVMVFLEGSCNQTIRHIDLQLWFLYSQLHDILISILAFNENFSKDCQLIKKSWKFFLKFLFFFFLKIRFLGWFMEEKHFLKIPKKIFF